MMHSSGTVAPGHAMVSNSGRLSAVASDDMVELFLSTGQTLQRVYGLQTNCGGSVTSVCGNEDYIIASASNGAVRMWHFTSNTDPACDLDLIFH